MSYAVKEIFYTLQGEGAGIDPVAFQGLPFTHFFLPPMDGPDRRRNTQLAVQYCLEHPRWRLSVQTHKPLGIP